MKTAWLLLTGYVSLTLGLDNGLALTPPMGWLTWLKFGCTTDCRSQPNECISERLIKRTADLMVTEGYLAAGYQYLGIDDCWLETERGPDGRMVPDKQRFPSGMKALADYVHNKGLKFGMYQDYGYFTCAGYPGIINHVATDISSFIEWEIDYLKLDGCSASKLQKSKGYPAFQKLLNATGRPVVLSCSWPAYEEIDYVHSNYGSIAQHCNTWRNWYDIADSWYNLTPIMDWFGDNQKRFAKYAGPGNWNDPDVLLVGNAGLSVDQAQVQMAVWAVLAAPLIMSVDLAAIRPEFKKILLNQDVIAVNQDALGKQGLRVWKDWDPNELFHIEIWNRQLFDGSHALAFVNRANSTAYTTFTFYQMKMEPNKVYEVQDLFENNKKIYLCPNKDFKLRINPTGVKFYKFISTTNEDNRCKKKKLSPIKQVIN